ncbi:aldo/keto reductase [Oscillospiraceae bacterium MB08-C2-2]|nr:aldo/keto reductase [Oscillospiraceae bacterium MB08-C2-2]
MNKREIGKSGIMATTISLGSWAIGGGSAWGDNSDDESIRTIHAALDGGINVVDTAPVYGKGHSETVVGKALKGRRDQVLISTKCGLNWNENGGVEFFSRDGYTIYRNLTAKSIREDVEGSLRRLGTDYIDIYFTHWQAIEPLKTPISETMTALMELKKEGKIRAIGGSNVSLEDIKEYQKYGQFDIIQEKFSMLDRKIDAELLPYCEKNDITVMAYSPIEQGLLTGKVTVDYQAPEGSTKNRQLWWQPENRCAAIHMLDGWKDLCEKYSCTLTHLVVAWSVEYSPALNILCGARKEDQIVDILGAAKVKLEAADFERMRRDADQVVAGVVK